jgi:hypothetical protein
VIASVSRIGGTALLGLFVAFAPLAGGAKENRPAYMSSTNVDWVALLPPPPASSWSWRRSKLSYQPQNFRKHVPWHRDLGHLELT